MRRAPLFATVRTEGGLLPADLLSRVASLDKDLDGLSPEAYHLLANERIGEAVARSWNRMVGAWAAFRDALEALPPDDRGTTVTRRFLLALFQELGYGQLQAARGFEVDGKPYPVSHEWGSVPIHLVGARVGLDERSRGVAGAATMSPHATVQELLNRSDDHLWGFVSNGTRLRLLRDNAALTRQASVEFDLEAMFTGLVYADFVVLWMVCHQSRVEGDPPAKCLLEAWSAEAAARGTRALDQLRVGVEAAINELGAGFLAHPANGGLRERLRSGDLDKREYYRQLLRLVYRLLFLLVAESRDLLLDPAIGKETARARYRDWYSLDRLRRIAEERRGGPHSDLWRQLGLVFDWLGQGGGQPSLALPALGSFLWSRRATPDLDGADLANANLLAALRALTVLRDDKERVARHVDYRNLGAEELGSVYESLLELHPVLEATTGAFSLATAGGNERKTTGSYYTPSSLIAELLDSALEPVLDDAVRGLDADAAERALLEVTVLDPACGSGHFLIAAAHRIATRLASVRAGDPEPGPDAVHEALRDVVARCIHGVDVNEMAVELCKVSLWMESMVRGLPLSFLDHRIVCGNSLLGATPRLLAAGVPDEAFKPLSSDEKAVVTRLRKVNRQLRETGLSTQGVFRLDVSVADQQAPARLATAEVDAIPNDSIADLARKEQRWSEFERQEEAKLARLAADAWCAAFVAPKRRGEPVINDGVARRIGRGETIEAGVLASVERLRTQYRFLHLHLAFPQVFNVPADLDPKGDGPGWEGGFTLVLGNPPWERVKLQEKEFFAERHPDIANAPNAAARKKLIAALVEEDPALNQAFLDAVRKAEGESHFLRSSGRYPLCGRGDVNTYTVFAESMRAAIAPVGRAGVVVPSGIATDDTTKHFFGDLVERQSLVSLFDFENAVPIFPGVHRSFKFCLLTLTGDHRPADQAQFVFFAHRTADLADPDRRFTLSPADFRLINPSTRSCPIFRSSRDAELSKAIARRIPSLVPGERGNDRWGFSYKEVVHLAHDSSRFISESMASAIPVREAKTTWLFDHRAADVVLSATAMIRQGQSAALSDNDHRDPKRLPRHRFWVDRSFIDDRLDGVWSAEWMLGFRDITSTTNERTLLASIVPYSGLAHTMPLGVVKSEWGPLLTSVLSSLVCDYTCRQRLGGLHLTMNVMRNINVLPPSSLQNPVSWGPPIALHVWLKPRVLELTYTAWDLEAFANDLGYYGPPLRWDEDRRALLRAELDACFFHLYGIGRDDVDYILGTFPIVNRKDVAKYGDECTRRLILERYDALAAATASGVPYQTVLDPPPADPAVAHPEPTRPDWAKPPARARD